MGLVVIDESILDSLGNSIRSKTGKTALIPSPNMPSEVDSIYTTDEDDVLRDLRGSFTANVGEGYNNKSLAELVGTAEGRSDRPNDSSNIAYNDGELYALRESIGYIAILFDEENLSTTNYQKINTSVEIIESSLADIKSKVVATLNSILEPETEYDTDTPWFEIKELVENLPDDVGSQTASAVDSNSASLRISVDNAISAIVTEYGLDVELVTGTWEATLNNLTDVCAALAAVNAIPEKGFVLGDYDSDGYPTSLRFVGNWTGIPNSSFYNVKATTIFKKITDVILPDSVINLGDSAFRECTFARNINIPKYIQSIGVFCFYGSPIFSEGAKTRTLIIPSTIRTIGNAAFRGGHMLKVKYEGNVPTIFENQYQSCPCEEYDFSHHTGTIPNLWDIRSLGHASGCIIKVPQSLLTEWQSATNWSGLTDVEWQGV